MTQTDSSIEVKAKVKINPLLFFILFGTITISVIVTMLNHYKIINFGLIIPSVLRWIAITVILFYAYKKKSLTTWILISMLVGAEFGHDFPAIAINLNVLSKIFLNLIKTVIAPLLLSTLVVGIAGHSNLKQVGRMGWKSIVYFEVVSTFAMIIGLIAINLSQAGVGVQLPETVGASPLKEVPKQTALEIILHAFPENIAKSVYEGQVLQIVIFSIIFGISLAMIKEKHRKPMLTAMESLAEVMFKFTNLIMLFAPFAVFAAIAYTIGHLGIGVMLNLFKLLATLYLALTFFLLFVLLPAALIFRIPVRKFISAISEPVSIAFATTSSESALPKAMERMEQFGVPRKIVAFVIPTGYSFNLDGTSLYLALAALFVAQVAGRHIPFNEQILMLLTLMLTSKGVAGVPRASLVILIGTAANFNLPITPIFIIMGIDELMDMARTAINVLGNCLASAVVARWEGEFDDKAALNFNVDNVK
jgi:proton glutamate symport protein